MQRNRFSVLSKTADGRRRLRVAHVALSFGVGGAERLLVEFARHVDRDRFDFCFVALAEDGAIGEQLRSTGWPVEALNGRDGLRPGLVLQLARCLRRRRVDIVHTHLDRPHIYGTLAARISGVRRIVHTRHGQGGDLTARQQRLVRMLAGMTDRFICVSNDAARIACRDHGISRSRVSTIWNGVDLNRFSVCGEARPGPVVAIARLVPEKDLQCLVRAAAIALKSDPTLCFEVAGEGPCRRSLESLSDELGISNRVRFLGAVNDVRELLLRAGMFVMSSQTEGISVAILEAQAHFVPVVATNVGGNREIIEHAHSGLLVPARDPHALARAVLQLQRDRDLARRLAATARRRVEDEFDVTRMISRYQSLYESLLTPGCVERP